jgi:hypothetical protein
MHMGGDKKGIREYTLDLPLDEEEAPQEEAGAQKSNSGLDEAPCGSEHKPSVT